VGDQIISHSETYARLAVPASARATVDEAPARRPRSQPAGRTSAAEPERLAAVVMLAPVLGAALWAALVYGALSLF